MSWFWKSEQERNERAKREMATFKTIRALAQKSQPSSVVSENGTTVSYQKALSFSSGGDAAFFQKTDEKIREILRNNPQSDIVLHSDALGIVVISLERAPKKSAPNAPTDDVELGDIT